MSIGQKKKNELITCFWLCSLCMLHTDGVWEEGAMQHDVLPLRRNGSTFFLWI
jgi:hypothetical protein